VISIDDVGPLSTDHVAKVRRLSLAESEESFRTTPHLLMCGRRGLNRT